MAEKNYRAELIALFGDPVDANPTGAVEETAFASFRLNYRYITCRVLRGEIGDAIAGMRAMHMRGANLTMPHKVDVLPYLDRIGRSASIIGAVNTIVCKNGKLIGENTDGRGFVRSLTDAGISLDGKTLCVLGAGGAARAICVECALAGARRVVIINRTAERGEALRDLLIEKAHIEAEYLPWEGTANIPEGTDILINATCVGLAPDVDAYPDICYEDISEGMVVCDVVFNPALTAFLRRAAERGARCVNGLGMLANQAALNFEIWTDVRAPRETMMRALQREFDN